MNKKQRIENAINLLLEELRGVDFDKAKYIVQVIELHLTRNSTVDNDISDIDKVQLLNEDFDYFEGTFND
ncbi:hypothetical protein HZP28_00880 [Elizabethkingia anophelis]|uniref:hypothetical protein n=1 Tax=Elizabethkingia anophelis TaxID=1117645 RepID=UPI0004032B03|nr:hypothetical protein [Elizabethkingia anophelis]MCT4183072.1 hypothetical protein [Elizabethkingia anophelis]MCT4271334.1 hypothetical protein [Elizabethkingia anophelis]MCT4288902.1 hypothetical protein [Elizabethkingia anophelis]